MNQLSDDTFERFLSRAFTDDLIDLRDIDFMDPYGMIGVLETGRMLRSKNIFKTLLLPESELVLKYLERMDFFRYAAQYFDLVPDKPYMPDKYLRSACSDVLLEITPIERSDDIHFIVGLVKKRAQSILEKHLHYDEQAVNGFIVALSEVCQNIIEHSENTGFVGIQKYHFNKYNRNIVKIAVMDLGIGFKQSLSSRVAPEDDIEAIDKALLHAVSRYSDEGRGHGLAAVRRFVEKWDGKLSIRSGSGRLSIIPEWSWGKHRESNLAYFPGAQINIILPEVQGHKSTEA